MGREHAGSTPAGTIEVHCSRGRTAKAPAFQAGLCGFKSHRGLTRLWLSGRAPPCHGGLRGFEPRQSLPGCGVAWPSRLVRDEEIAGSNPAIPTGRGRRASEAAGASTRVSQARAGAPFASAARPPASSRFGRQPQRSCSPIGRGTELRTRRVEVRILLGASACAHASALRATAGLRRTSSGPLVQR
jgi:hypothetical protein